MASASAADGLVGVVLDKTSFYAQAGGQVWDMGKVALANGASLDVTNVQVRRWTKTMRWNEDEDREAHEHDI